MIFGLACVGGRIPTTVSPMRGLCFFGIEGGDGLIDFVWFIQLGVSQKIGLMMVEGFGLFFFEPRNKHKHLWLNMKATSR